MKKRKLTVVFVLIIIFSLLTGACDELAYLLSGSEVDESDSSDYAENPGVPSQPVIPDNPGTNNPTPPVNKDPVVQNFSFSGLGTFVYDGTPRAVTVTPIGMTSTGEITVFYSQYEGNSYYNSSNSSTIAPTGVGMYRVHITVEASPGYNYAVLTAPGVNNIPGLITIESPIVSVTIGLPKTIAKTEDQNFIRVNEPAKLTVSAKVKKNPDQTEAPDQIVTWKMSGKDLVEETTISEDGELNVAVEDRFKNIDITVTVSSSANSDEDPGKSSSVTLYALEYLPSDFYGTWFGVYGKSTIVLSAVGFQFRDKVTYIDQGYTVEGKWEPYTRYSNEASPFKVYTITGKISYSTYLTEMDGYKKFYGHVGNPQTIEIYVNRGVENYITAFLSNTFVTNKDTGYRR